MPESITENNAAAGWTYEDLGLLIGSVLPTLAISVVVARAAATSSAIRTLILQSLFYCLLGGILYLLVAVRRGQPFWRSLGFTLPPSAGLWFAYGPLLAFGIGIVGTALRAPIVRLPVEDFITGRASLVVMGLFVGFLGPAFEELLFRGFVYPLLAGSVGPIAGLFLTALPFALLHGPEYRWAWQQIVLIGLAGAAFGYARYKTGSTAASMLLHAGFNLTMFVAMVAQQKPTATTP